MATAKKPSHQTPKERRAACNPVMIGLLIGFFAPWVGIIYGIRQRSWSVGLVAFIPVIMWIFSNPDWMYEMRSPERYIAQFAGGALTWYAALLLKNKAKDELAKKIND